MTAGSISYAATRLIYDSAASVLRSLASPGVDQIAAELRERVRTVVEDCCR
jgi:hypothetical protein